MSNCSAYWRMPSPKQMEKLAREAPQRPAESTDDGWWDLVLNDPRAAGTPRLPIHQMRLNEIPRHLLRVECMRCARIVEIQKVDAVKLYGPHAVWKDVGQKLLDDGCQRRTGRHEEDGCWPDWGREPEMYNSLLIPFIAAVAAGIAFLQWRTAHQKVLLDLFERRLKIHEDVNTSNSGFSWC